MSLNISTSHSTQEPLYNQELVLQLWERGELTRICQLIGDKNVAKVD
jgi:hypothetical protein